MRNTKIICTLGPATESPEKLRKLIRAGTNVFRLNMSHATHDWVRTVVRNIREVSRELDTITGIMMDTQGPAIRTGDLDSKLDLKVGDTLDFSVRGEKSEDIHSVDVNYPGLINDISVGDTVLVDNGVIHLKVLSKKDPHIHCEVLTPGTLGSRRHINLPGVKVNLPPLTPKDLDDIQLGVAVGVDFVALSFCREAADIKELRRVLDEAGSTARTIAKIEDQNAVSVIQKIITAADCIMIARGDLGIECPMEELPIIQRRIVKKCIQLGRPVIVATHMLESMIENPLPTRAEITDVANAVYEEADAIMLSGETTIGKYPVECVNVFVRVAERIELSGGLGFAEGARMETVRHKTASAAVQLANSLPRAHILVFTKRGVLANRFSQLRPLKAPIFAFTPSEEVARGLTINCNTHPLVMNFEIHPEHTIAAAEKLLLSRGLIESGDQLIILTDVLAGGERFDSIQVRHVVEEVPQEKRS